MYQRAHDRLKLTNYPLALRFKRIDVTHGNQFNVPNFDRFTLAEVKRDLRQKAQKKADYGSHDWQAQLDAHPHIFAGDEDYSSPETEEDIIIPFTAETKLSDITLAIADDLELCDTIALVHMYDGRQYQNPLERLTLLIEGDILTDAFEKIRAMRRDKQALFKSIDGPMSYDVLWSGIRKVHSYVSNNAFFMALPEAKIPSFYGMRIRALWVEDKQGYRILPEYFFLVADKDAHGRDVWDSYAR